METSIIKIKGIGEKSAKAFEKAGIFTIRDLIAYYPKRYIKLEEPVLPSEAGDGLVAAISGYPEGRMALRYVRGMAIVTGTIQCQGQSVSVTWFHMPYLARSLKSGQVKVFRGMIRQGKTHPRMVQPAIYDPSEYESLRKYLQPVYPLTGSLSAGMLRKALGQVFSMAEGGEGEVADGTRDVLTEYLPSDIREQYHLASYAWAAEQIHFPADTQALLTARTRLVFDEFLLFILSLSHLKKTRSMVLHDWSVQDFTHARQVISNLPYELTGAQKTVWGQIAGELSGRKVMARLVQGDVGSGKTIVAFLAMISVASSGKQAALMAPTEVLARQHARSLAELLQRCSLPYKSVILTGSSSAQDRREALQAIADGSAALIIGTHALFQEKVNYHALGLVVTDEQHRFGVKQRELLAKKGETPHVLVMSATPIPRTLAVVLYGDLDISIIDQMPSDRLSVKNAVVGPEWREKAYQFIEKQVREGHQAYIICPLVEESEFSEGENVQDYAKNLKEQLPSSFRIDYLHGQMPSADKNEVMERFAAGVIDVLVSTTVIEVGVNVPRATVMMIENADRFGLAQLHQLRGRVGRGSAQSYCIFMATSKQAAGGERLKILQQSNDGFEIASKDMKLRGPGDLFGIRQSGELDFRLADVYADAAILDQAQSAARDILNNPEILESEEYRLLKEKMLTAMGNTAKNLNI